MKHAGLRFVLVLAAMTAAVPVLARAPDDDEKAQAKEAYDRGLAAHNRGDARSAADEFARADALAPNPVALRAALDAALESNDAPLAAELVERSKRDPSPPPGLASTVSAAQTKFRSKTGKVRVTCPAGTSCIAKLDDRPLDANRVVWARTGAHTVALVGANGEMQTKSIDVVTDQLVEVDGTNKSAPTTSAAPASDGASGTQTKDSHGRREGHGLPRAVFYGGVIVTGILAGATAYLAIHTSKVHSDFQSAGCTTANFTPCSDLQSSGHSSQSFTNVTLVSTMVFGIGTAIVGLLFTDWNAPLFGRDGDHAPLHVAF